MILFYPRFCIIQDSVLSRVLYYTGFCFIQGSVYTGFCFIQGSVYPGFTVPEYKAFAYLSTTFNTSYDRTFLTYYLPLSISPYYSCSVY
jgi:hypothetical protein